jgi:nucleoside-diphosphate-sugar epimerase
MPPPDWSRRRVILTGGAGFLGRHIHARLLARGVPASSIAVPRSRNTDLTNQAATRDLFSSFPGADVVIHCAGRVGGLGANRARPADFFLDNMAMAINLAHGALRDNFHQRDGRFLMVGSMTSYPAGAPVPFREDDLFDGLPEPDIAPYGVAKRAALTMLRALHAQHAFQSAYVIPCNLYGPGDNLDPASSHFVGATIDRVVEAQRTRAPSITCWGTGAPTREFLYIDDAAEGCIRALESITDATPVNLSPGREHSIRDTVHLVARLVGYTGSIQWDPTKPDGQGRRALDTTRARELLRWTAPTTLEEGLRRTIEWRMSLD